MPDHRNREIFRLRIVEGLTLTALGERFGLNRERVRQILAVYFGLTETPPAAKRSANVKPRLRACSRQR